MSKRESVFENKKLLYEWDWEENQREGFTPQNITMGSIKQIHWVCAKGHKWQASPNNRSKGNGCPVCAGRKIEPGYNDFATIYPELVKEWHPTKNEDLTPQSIAPRSSRGIWWKCAVCQHEWKASASNRASGKGCPICSRKKQGEQKIVGLIEKNGSLADIFPNLLSEWDYEKNEIKPENVTCHSNKRVWWRCSSCGYSWNIEVSHRTDRGSGCPVCANKVVMPWNSLEVLRPDLLEIWNNERNTSITAGQVTPGSNKKVWWKCKLGHEWMATVTSISNGGSCPICNGRKVQADYNSLAALNPQLAKEWHPTKNKTLQPTQVTIGNSTEKVWWLCPSGHEYQATIYNRNHGTGCPACQRELKTSFPEQAILFYFRKCTRAMSRYLLNGKTEIDIYLPELNVGIEYDGYRYHSGQEARKKEMRKDKIVNEAGIILFRVKEIKSESEIIPDDRAIYCKYDANYRYISDVMLELMKRIAENTNRILPVVDININRDSSIIYSQYIEGKKQNSLAEKETELTKEWHPTKNGYLRPNMISFSSAKKVWWLGKCGHEWQASVDNRRHGNGCPICAGFQVLEGYNDLATIFPELAKEWCLERNGDLLPTQVTRGSRKKVWWICSEGHEYESSVSNRVFGRGCPVCGVRRRGELRIKNKIAKEGSLAETNQKLSSEWHPTRNGDLKPENVTRGSDRKVWWKCERGHEYEATISNRSYGKGCPICAGKKIVHGINDLETMNLQLASEWNYKRNQEIMPSQVSPNSHKKVWWICDQGHEWEAQIKSRNMGTGCPICAKTKGYKDKKNNIK